MYNYEEGLFLSDAIGNNAFSYQKRKEKLSNCKIYIPSIKYINKHINDNLTLSELISFEEIDEKGNLVSNFGLKNHINIDNIYIVDNHNHALYRRYKNYIDNIIKKGSTLIHIDQHADMGLPNILISQNINNLKNEKQLEYIYNYTNIECNVGNFITPAQDFGLIGEVLQIRTRYNLSKILDKIQEIKNYNDIILDIDCDFWSDEIDKESINIVRKIMKYANIITIATSPYFITFEKAKKVIEMITKNY